jgi:tRNA A22 N-methylase
MTRKDLIDLIVNNGVENCKFRVPLLPVRSMFDIRVTSSDDEYVIVSARIDESKYKIQEGQQKITLRAEDERYDDQDFYIGDLLSMMEREQITMYVRADGRLNVIHV